MICHAIMPVLPFADEIDRFLSHDRVVAVFRSEGNLGLHVVETMTTVLFLTLRQFLREESLNKTTGDVARS